MKHSVVLVSAVLGTAVIAAGASADFSSFHDPRGDAKCLHDPHTGEDTPCLGWMRRNADIVRATAGHEGTRLRHTIRVVGKLQDGRVARRDQTLGLIFSTDSDKQCEWFLGLGGGTRHVEFRKVQDCRPKRGPGGRARVEFHRHSVEVLLSETSIGDPPATAGKP